MTERSVACFAGALGLALGLALANGAFAQSKPLYERLGGTPAIEMVVGQFLANVGADNRINQRFAKTDMAKLKKNLVDQICEASGGPCKYAGKDMPTAHKGMKIGADEFNWTGEHLASALDTFKVPKAEKDELLAVIGSLQGQIVNQ